MLTLDKSFWSLSWTYRRSQIQQEEWVKGSGKAGKTKFVGHADFKNSHNDHDNDHEKDY